MSQLGFPAVTPRDLHKLGPYSSPADISDLRHDFAEARLFSSVARLAREASQHVPDGRSVAAANALVNELLKRERHPDRFSQHDRAHDLLDGAEAIEQRVRRFTTARHLYTVHSGIYDLERQREACSALAGTIDFVVALTVERWVPAIQNILRRLTAAQRRQAESVAEQAMRRFLAGVDCLRAVYDAGGMEVETARWKQGVGTFDAVLLQVIGLFELACRLAGETTTARDRLSMHLRERAERAGLVLRAATDEWHRESTSAMHTAAGNASDELAAFALVYRGVSAEVEAHLSGMLARQNDDAAQRN